MSEVKQAKSGATVDARPRTSSVSAGMTDLGDVGDFGETSKTTRHTGHTGHTPVTSRERVDASRAVREPAQTL